ncbi:MAG: pirin family protein [Pseudomonadales bacterium]|jgi:redox-sensitive bicupin YhaK (pirin superfamily)|nr:pirin family protein [Pseudomonadales bacterium]
MSWQGCEEPTCTEQGSALATRIESRAKDLGGFSVRRVLPAAARRHVGPFVFFDQMGPADFGPGQGIEVRPHPHIGLATLTYLFEGEILHQDSLGYRQAIRPGAVNLMTAGRGIVHSERTDPALRRSGQRLHGIQSWMALPDALADCDPAFVHHPADSLPRVDRDGARITLVAGSAFGERSPVETASPTLYLDIALEPGARLAVPDARERGLFVAEGRVRVEGDAPLAEGTMGVLGTGANVTLEALVASRVILIGGEPVGPRELWWNFVARDPARIARARDDWRAGRFAMVPGDDEFIPLPEA